MSKKTTFSAHQHNDAIDNTSAETKTVIRVQSVA